MSVRSFQAADLDEVGTYRLLAGLVVPRPIALVSTVSPQGVPNLAPFSFFTIASAFPPVLAFSVGLRYGSQLKDTLLNIEANREFVVNIAGSAIAREMNAASLDFPADRSEFEKAGLTPAGSRSVAPPGVAEAQARLECRLLQTIPFRGWRLVLGEVVTFQLAPDILDDRGRVDLDRLDALGRLSGDAYCRTRDRFELSREADRPEARRTEATRVAR